jgi:hypothetical protein
MPVGDELDQSEYPRENRVVNIYTGAKCEYRLLDSISSIAIAACTEPVFAGFSSTRVFSFLKVLCC